MFSYFVSANHLVLFENLHGEQLVGSLELYEINATYATFTKNAQLGKITGALGLEIRAKNNLIVAVIGIHDE